MDIWLCLFVVFCAVPLLFCERLEDQIYLKLDGGRHQCFRLLNGTNEVGCQSAGEGNVGVVVYVNSAEQMRDLGSLFGPTMDLIIAVDVNSVNEKIVSVHELMQKRVRGVLFLNDVEDEKSRYLNGLSEDSSCPNQQFGIYGKKCQKEWNEKGALTPEGLRFVDWQKPVFLIENSTEIRIIKENCYKAFNVNGSTAGRPLCSANMKLFMRAAGNAEICLRRQEYFYGFSENTASICDPLEDRNLFAILPPPIKQEDENVKILVVAARMDSFSSFADAAVGDVSVLTSLISVLAVAKAVGENLKDFEAAASGSRRSVMFSFFHGESMGYIGSSRCVYDIMHGNFPVNSDDGHANRAVRLIQLSDIDAFIEVQQIEGVKSSFYAHVDGVSYFNGGKNMTDALLTAANAKLGNISSISVVSSLSPATELPPSSYQSFLKANRSIPGFVVAPFDDQFSYRQTNSFADRDICKSDIDKMIAKDQIFASATAVLGAVVKYVFPKETHIPAEYEINKEFISTLFDCFILSKDWYTCELFSRLLENEKVLQERGEKNTYITGGATFPSLIRLLVNALIVHSLGSKLANVTSQSQCNDLNSKHEQVYRFTWQYDPASNMSLCYRTTLYDTPAKSPAFEESGYDLKSGVYSTWVESVWSKHELVLFLTDHSYPKQDLVLFLSGCALLVVSFLIMELIYTTNKEAFEPVAPAPDADFNAAPL